MKPAALISTLRRHFHFFTEWATINKTKFDELRLRLVRMHNSLRLKGHWTPP
jgi:hypothetical protein